MKHLIALLSMMMFSTPALAIPTTFTGAELLNFPNIRFPHSTQSVDGDSLLLNNTLLGSGFAAVLPLDDFLSDEGRLRIELDFRINANDDEGPSEAFLVFISDGRNLFGSLLVHQFDEIIMRHARGSFSPVLGERVSLHEVLPGRSTSIRPTIGESNLLSLGIQLSATNTQIFGNIDRPDLDITDVTETPVDINNGGLSLVFAANRLGDNYRINELRFVEGFTVPEPNILLGFGFGLLGLGLATYRRRKTK